MAINGGTQAMYKGIKDSVLQNFNFQLKFKKYSLT